MISRSIGIFVLALLGSPAVWAGGRPDALETRGSARVILDARLSPRNTLQPSDRRVQVRVEPHADNRVLRLVLDADHFYRSTDIPLDGADAPTTHWVTWRSVPPGAYVLTVTVYGMQGPRGRRVERGAERFVALEGEDR